MEDKYYIPDIEDIHIGYEGEILIDKWEPFVLDKERVDHYSKWGGDACDIDDIFSHLKYGQIRTKYLTKKDIESEGWEIFKEHKYDDRNYKYPEIGKIYTKGNKYLSFYESINEIEIHNNEEYSDRQTWYDGKCKSINELKTISKLLNI